MRKGFAVCLVYVLALLVQISAPVSAALTLDRTGSQSTHDVMALCPHMAMEAGAPDKNHSGEHDRQHQQSCPFCALHCHAALLLPLAFIFANPSAIAKLPEALRQFAQPHLRYALAAQPRGPPRFA